MIRLPHGCVKPPIKVLNYQISCRLAFVLGFDQRIHKICVVDIFCILTLCYSFAAVVACWVASVAWIVVVVAAAALLQFVMLSVNALFDSIQNFLLPSFCYCFASLPDLVSLTTSMHFICLLNIYTISFGLNTVLNLSCIKMLLGNVNVSFDLRCTSSCFITPFVFNSFLPFGCLLGFCTLCDVIFVGCCFDEC